MTLAVLGLPAVSLANTYQYVDSGGVLRSMQANSAVQALATAPNIGLHSGVVLVTIGGTGTGGSYESVTTGNTFYQFIDRNGKIQSVNAASASIALASAPNIAPNSGVILVTNSTKLSN